jgi:iron(III) transport system permease protein
MGMGFAYFQPPGLIDPPPLELARVWPLLGRTLALAIVVSTLALIAGTCLGFIQARAEYPGRKLLALLSILPLAIPSYLIAAIVRESMAPKGIIGSLLGTEGAFSGFWPAVLVLTVACTPYVHILVAAALERSAGAEEEAARALGANPVRVFANIHVPRLRPTWAFSLVLVALYVISDFGAVAILDCRVLTWELYQARGAQDAVLLGFAIMACVIPILTVVRLLSGRSQPSRQLSRARAPYRLHLSNVSLSTVYLLHGLIIGVGVLLPVLFLFKWVVAGFMNNAEFAPLTGPILTTAVYTLVGASVTLICALIPAWTVARNKPSRAGVWMENATYLTSAVPGILLAFGMLHLTLGLKRHVPIELAGTSLWGWLESLGLILLMGYMMRFLAEGYAALKPAILGLDLRQEESAKSLGASRFRRLRYVTLPLLGPGIAAAFLLLFLSIAKELPVTLMLTPAGKQTLAYRVFDAQQEASLTDVGAAGLLLLLLAVGMQLLISRRRHHA